MAITDWDTYASRVLTPVELGAFVKVASTTIAGRLYDSWAIAADAGAAPTSAVVPTNATAGAVGGASNRGQQDGTNLRLLLARLSSNFSGTFMLCDRLSHQGGLNATTTGVVTTNLPTAALTRYTSGEGVWMGLTVYSQIGASTTSIVCSYTNQAGTGGQASPSIVIGNTGFREVNRMLLMPLASGDTGVRSVENVNLNATTGTAGNYGVTLFKPLMSFIVERPGGQVTFSLVDGGSSGGLPEIVDGSCLFWLYCPASTSTALSGQMTFAED